MSCDTYFYELGRRFYVLPSDRGHPLPRWLVDLHRAEPVDRAVELSTPFRVVDELLVGVVLPGGQPVTALVRIDNELGFRAAGASVFLEHLATREEFIKLVVAGPSTVL